MQSAQPTPPAQPDQPVTTAPQTSTSQRELSTTSQQVSGSTPPLHHLMLPKLLEAPVLIVVVLIGFAVWLRKEIRSMLSRKSISISWGDGSIQLTDLSENLDKELEPIRDEIEGLKRALSEPSHSDASRHAVPSAPSAVGNNDVSLPPGASERIEAALEHSQFKWRSIGRLAAAAGITEEQALAAVRVNPKMKLGVGKSGSIIAALKSRVGS
jgi:hypothetical protein